MWKEITTFLRSTNPTNKPLDLKTGAANSHQKEWAESRDRHLLCCISCGKPIFFVIHDTWRDIVAWKPYMLTDFYDKTLDKPCYRYQSFGKSWLAEIRSLTLHCTGGLTQKCALTKKTCDMSWTYIYAPSIIWGPTFPNQLSVSRDWLKY